jgi:SAM-dependent methyltransferase
VSEAERNALTFTCNVCGRPATADRSSLLREGVSCRACGSSVRYRAVVHALSLGLFGQSLPLTRFPRCPDVVGAGLSDWSGYAERLPAKLAYRNTYYHLEPRLDITAPPTALEGSLDFLISSDVFEHVAPPVARAFEGAFRLLRPGGLLVLTVPYSDADELVEHFPDLHEYEIVAFRGGRLLVNRTADGRWQVLDDLRFHGGVGETLELRQFTRSSLWRLLEEAGFAEIVECAGDCEEFGILWAERDGMPFLARRRRR